MFSTHNTKNRSSEHPSSLFAMVRLRSTSGRATALNHPHAGTAPHTITRPSASTSEYQAVTKSGFQICSKVTPNATTRHCLRDENQRDKGKMLVKLRNQNPKSRPISRPPLHTARVCSRFAIGLTSFTPPRTEYHRGPPLSSRDIPHIVGNNGNHRGGKGKMRLR